MRWRKHILYGKPAIHNNSPPLPPRACSRLSFQKETSVRTRVGASLGRILHIPRLDHIILYTHGGDLPPSGFTARSQRNKNNRGGRWKKC